MNYMKKHQTVRDVYVLCQIVQDNGIGMTEDYMKKMYERFSRSVDTRSIKSAAAVWDWRLSR